MNRLVVLIAAGLLASAAAAQHKPQVARAKVSESTFASLDKNADQQISKTEAGMDRKLSDGFAYVDTNGDGFISREEYFAQNKAGEDAS